MVANQNEKVIPFPWWNLVDITLTKWSLLNTSERESDLSVSLTIFSDMLHRKGKDITILYSFFLLTILYSKGEKKVQSNHEETIKPKLTEISLDNLPVWINYFSSTKDRGLGTFLSSVDLLKKMKELWQLNATHNPIGSWIKTNKPNAIKDIIRTSRIILMWAVI